MQPGVRQLLFGRRLPVRRNTVIDRWDGRLAQSTEVGYTWHTQYSPGHEFTAVRLIFANNESVSVPIDKAIVAVTATLSLAATLAPSVGNTVTNNPATGWVSVTFGGIASGTIPARIGANNPSFLMSDWITLPSIACTDQAGQPPIAMARALVGAAGTTYSIGANNLSPWANAFQYPTFPNGRFMRTRKQTGDCIATPADMTSTTNENNGVIAGMEFRTPSSAITLMGCGDSITAGSSANYLNGWGLRTATTLSALQRIPLGYFNNGWGGQSSLQYYTRAVSALTSSPPDVMVYPPYSPNDGFGTGGYTIALRDAARAQMLSLMALCQRAGVPLVLTTGIPYSGNDQTKDDLRKGLNAEIRSMTGAGIYTADFDSAVSDNGSPALIRAEYDVDGTHPNDAGHAAMSAVLIPVIRKALAI